MEQTGGQPPQPHQIVPPEAGFINPDEPGNEIPVSGGAGDVPVPHQESLPRPAEQKLLQDAVNQPRFDALAPEQAPGADAAQALHGEVQADLEAEATTKVADTEDRAADKHAHTPKEELAESPKDPESSQDTDLKFKPADISFIHNIARHIADLHIKVTDPQIRQSEIVRLIGDGFSYVNADKNSDDPSKNLGLVFSALSLGAAPSAEQSEGVARQLTSQKELSQQELNNLLALNSLAWQQRISGLPDAKVAFSIHDQVGGALSMLRQQPDYEFGKPTPYETALIAFATGVSSSVPQMMPDGQLVKTMEAQLRAA
jgi:hypothetical protein